MARAMGPLGATPLRMPWPQYLLFFRPEEEEEDLPGLKGFEPDEPEEPFGFLGAGLVRVRDRVRVRVRVRVRG